MMEKNTIQPNYYFFVVVAQHHSMEGLVWQIVHRVRYELIQKHTVTHLK